MQFSMKMFSKVYSVFKRAFRIIRKVNWHQHFFYIKFHVHSLIEFLEIFFEEYNIDHLNDEVSQ